AKRSWRIDAPKLFRIRFISGSLASNGAYSDRCTAGPERAALEDRAHLRHGELVGGVAERAVEDAALAIAALPDDRHDDAVDEVEMFAGKRRCRQHLVGRVDM